MAWSKYSVDSNTARITTTILIDVQNFPVLSCTNELNDTSRTAKIILIVLFAIYYFVIQGPSHFRNAATRLLNMFIDFVEFV
jgi:hypothetical protein